MSQQPWREPWGCGGRADTGPAGAILRAAASSCGAAHGTQTLSSRSLSPVNAPPFQTASLLHSPKPARMLGVESRDPCSEGPWLSQLFLTGPLYLLIYFPDCCLTLLELLPPQPSGGSHRGRSWSLSSWCCEELEGSLPHLGQVRKGLPSLLRSHLKLLQGSAPWGGAHTGYPGGRGER